MNRTLLIYIFANLFANQALGGENFVTYPKITCMPELNYIEITTVGLDFDKGNMHQNQKINEKYGLVEEKECPVGNNKYKFKFVPQKGQINATDRCSMQPGTDLYIWRNEKLVKKISKFMSECDYLGLPLLVIDQWERMTICSNFPHFSHAECKSEDFVN